MASFVSTISDRNMVIRQPVSAQLNRNLAANFSLLRENEKISCLSGQLVDYFHATDVVANIGKLPPVCYYIYHEVIQSFSLTLQLPEF
jgi:hypothetical protein